MAYKSNFWQFIFSTFVFNGKEKDYESGYHYYGSRYYNSELSMWLSVDPMSDKYPSLTPYNYCANNPVKLIDPNGEDIDPASETQHIKNLRNPNHREYNQQFAAACLILEDDHSTLYKFNMKSESKKEDGREIFGSVTYEGQKQDGKDIININYTTGLYKKDGALRTNKDFVMFEEVFHCVQFAHGEWGFGLSKDGKWYGTLGLDIMDEVNAKNEAARALKMTPDFTKENILEDYPRLEKILVKTAATSYNSNINNIEYRTDGSNRVNSNNYLFKKPND